MKKIISALAALAVGLGLAVVAVPVTASAHTGAVTGAASCQVDGTYSVVWTYKQTNTPSSGSGSQTDVKVLGGWTPAGSVITSDADNPGDTVFLNEAIDHAANNKSNQHRLGNWTQKFYQVVPGNTTSASVQVQTDWLGWGAADNWGNVEMAGDCTATLNDAAASINITPGTCFAAGTATIGTVLHATWDGVLDTTPGTHTELFTSTAGHDFPGGWDTKLVEYTVPDRDRSLCPTNEVCESYTDLGTSTDINPNGWANFESKPGGTATYVDGGLYLDNIDGNSKVAWIHSVPINSLADIGQVAVNYTHDSGVLASGPGINIFVDFDNNGSYESRLVGEPNAYPGQDWWATGSSITPNGAPQTGGGYGSNRHGTIDEWLQLYGDVPVAPTTAFAYGTGGPANGTLHSINLPGCTYADFDKADLPETPEPKIEYAYTEWTDGEYACGDTSVTVTRESTKTTTTYKVIVTEGEYEVVIDEVIVDDPVTEYDTRQLDESELITCATPTAPVFKDECGIANDKVILPDTEGVTYSIEWSEDGNTATVTATADEGYELVPAEGEEELVTEWSHTFTNEACPTTPPVDTPRGGLAQTGTDIGLSLIGGAAVIGGILFLIFGYRRRSIN